MTGNKIGNHDVTINRKAGSEDVPGNRKPKARKYKWNSIHARNKMSLQSSNISNCNTENPICLHTHKQPRGSCMNQGALKTQLLQMKLVASMHQHEQPCMHHKSNSHFSKTVPSIIKPVKLQYRKSNLPAYTNTHPRRKCMNQGIQSGLLKIFSQHCGGDPNCSEPLLATTYHLALPQRRPHSKRCNFKCLRHSPHSKENHLDLTVPTSFDAPPCNPVGPLSPVVTLGHQAVGASPAPLPR